MPEPKTAEGWAASCYHLGGFPMIPTDRAMCPDCCRAYARQVEGAVREDIAGMLERGEWSGDGSMDAIVAAIRVLPAEDTMKKKAHDIGIAGVWPEDDLRRAFVAGAAWWEYDQAEATMWHSDRDRAEAEAERRYPKGKPRPPFAE